MNKKLKCLSIAIAMTFAFTAFGNIKSVSAVESAKTNISSSRISGDNRYLTAIEVSKIGWEKSDNVIVATGENFADALCSIPLSKLIDAPILLVSNSDSSEAVQKEITRLKAKNIYIVGGTGAVSDKIMEDFNKLDGVKTERINGKNRFDTSVLLSNKYEEIAKKQGKTQSDKVAIVYGYNFADAISIASTAASLGMPIILSDSSILPIETEKYLKDRSIKNIYMVGGEAVLNNSVKDKINEVTKIDVKRLSGKDRYDTNLVVLKEFESLLKYNKVYLAKGGKEIGDFADSLVGAALAAKNNSPLILVNTEMKAETMEYLQKQIKNIENIVTIGGNAAISEEVAKQIDKNLNEEKVKNSKPVENPSVPQSWTSTSTPSPSVETPVVNDVIYGTNPKVQIHNGIAILSYVAEEDDLGVVILGYEINSDNVKFASAASISQFDKNIFKINESITVSGKYKAVFKITKRDKVVEKIVEFEIK